MKAFGLLVVVYFAIVAPACACYECKLEGSTLECAPPASGISGYCECTTTERCRNYQCTTVCKSSGGVCINNYGCDDGPIVTGTEETIVESNSQCRGEEKVWVAIKPLEGDLVVTVEGRIMQDGDSISSFCLEENWSKLGYLSEHECLASLLGADKADVSDVP